MTDNEIVKALECCKKGTALNCKDCHLYEDKGHTCITILTYNALDLINRQKAEIEWLQGQIGNLNKEYPCTVDVGNNCLVYARSLDDYDNLIGDISAEGIKEFWDKVKEKAYRNNYCQDVILVEDGDNILEEVVGD